MKQFLAIAALVALGAAPASAQPSSPDSTSVNGKIVDLATYITRDHNMDAMKGGHAMAGDAMKGDSMKGDSMKGDAMKGDAVKGDAMKGDAMKGDSMKGDAMSSACPAMLGVVTPAGRAYPLAFQEGSAMAASACKHLNAAATLTGKSYSQGGTTIFLVSAIR